jgi:Serine dehydrogenase proteinase
METARYTLVWFSMDSIDVRQLVPVRRRIEDMIKEPQESVEIDLWLESPGGDAHTAYKLALILRATASKIRIIVPDYAKSAATLLALAGDEIYMAPGAELGPLDGQMPDEGSLFGSISALNIAKAADDVASTAVALASRGGAQLFYSTGLKREQTLEAMLRFVATFSEPLVRQLDPRLIHDAKQTLKVTKQYAERLLTRTMPRARAAEVATALVENYPTHGFVIAYDEAELLGLPVRPIAEYDRHEQMKRVHRAAEDGDALISLVSDDNLTNLTGEENDDELTEESPSGEDTENDADGS